METRTIVNKLGITAIGGKKGFNSVVQARRSFIGSALIFDQKSLSHRAGDLLNRIYDSLIPDESHFDRKEYKTLYY